MGGSLVPLFPLLLVDLVVLPPQFQGAGGREGAGVGGSDALSPAADSGGKFVVPQKGPGLRGQSSSSSE